MSLEARCIFWCVLLSMLSSCACILEHDAWWNNSTAAELAAGETSHVTRDVLGITAADFPKIAESASRGEIKAIRQVQKVTGHGDAAGNLGQTFLIQKVLEKAGDAQFAEALSAQSKKVILAHSYLRDANHYNPITQKESLRHIG